MIWGQGNDENKQAGIRERVEGEGKKWKVKDRVEIDTILNDILFAM